MKEYQALYKDFLRAGWTLATMLCPVILAYNLMKRAPWDQDYSKDWHGDSKKGS